MGPITRDELRSACGELYDIFNEWDGLIDCEEDADGFPVGDSLEANVKRMIDEVTTRMSRIMFNSLVRGMEAAPPVDIKDLEDRDD